jgi:hypothetical protein
MAKRFAAQRQIEDEIATHALAKDKLRNLAYEYASVLDARFDLVE